MRKANWTRVLFLKPLRIEFSAQQAYCEIHKFYIPRKFLFIIIMLVFTGCFRQKMYYCVVSNGVLTVCDISSNVEAVTIN